MLQDTLIDCLSWIAQGLLVIVVETGQVFYESALFILLGFLAAGLLREFVPAQLLQRHLGKESPTSVLRAALMGAPLPLCSCGVLPMAVALRNKGASRSAVTSFLISTPETGVDSIALTYALMGPVMMVVRPVMAVLTAFVAGVSVLLLGNAGAPSAPSVAGGFASHDDGHNHPHTPLETLHESKRSFSQRSRRVVEYGFKTLFDEIAVWIFIGLLLTGILVTVLPGDFFSGVLGLGSGLLPMLLMVLIGIPLYLCASASTPVAAALVATGLSPGAALVFLLAGPATNLAALSVIARLLGYRILAVYLCSIVMVALAGGLLVDLVFGEWIRTGVNSALGNQDQGLWQWLKWLAVAVLGILLIASFRRGSAHHGLAEWRQQNRQLAVVLGQMNWREHGVRLVQKTGLQPLVHQLAQHKLPLRRVMFGFTATAGLLMVVVVSLPMMTLTVQPGQQGIIQRFGQVQAENLPPGLYWHWPPPLGKGISVDAALIRQVTVGRITDEKTSVVSPAPGFFLTGDENIVEVSAVVQYRITDAARFALDVEHNEALLQDVARQTLTGIIATLPIDKLYSMARAQVEQRFHRRLQQRVATMQMGYGVSAARLLYIHAPAAVHDAFRDVASALEDQTRVVLEAQGKAAATLAQARGGARETLAAAQSEAIRMSHIAAGETAPFRALARVFKEHPQVTRKRLHLEALERYLAEPKKYVNGVGAAGDNPDLWLGTSNSDALRFRYREE